MDPDCRNPETVSDYNSHFASKIPRVFFKYRFPGYMSRYSSSRFIMVLEICFFSKKALNYYSIWFTTLDKVLFQVTRTLFLIYGVLQIIAFSNEYLQRIGLLNKRLF